MVRRIVVFSLSLLGFLVCATLLVREVVLAADAGTSWGAPGWYSDLLADGSWGAAGAAGLVLLALVVLCLVLVVLLLVPRPAAPRELHLGQPDARVTVPIAALERLFAAVLASDLGRAGRVRRVRVERRQGRLVARTRVTVVPTDVIALHRRVLLLARRDLGGASGLEVERLVLEVDRFINPEEAPS